MRNKFDEQLVQLSEDLISMGALCESAIAGAIKSLENGDREMAGRIAASDSRVDEKEREIERLCLKLLLQQQPVARDLRLISAALKMITDLERIGDQAADIAEIVSFAADTLSGVPQEHLRTMANEAISMVTGSVDAFVRHDLDLVHRIIAHDDVVDGLFDTVKSELVELIVQDKSRASQAMDILMIAKYLERIGDHAVNVAEWVEFSITGHHEE